MIEPGPGGRCSGEECPAHDGKRCRVIGARPGEVCEAKSIDVAGTAEAGEPVFEVVRITPRPGPQTAFIASEADIAIYGGGAGGHDVGKGWALAFLAGAHFEVPGYVGVIFRRRGIDLDLPGAVREVAESMYQKTGATSKNYQGFRRSTWASGANVVTAFVKDDGDARDMGAARFAFVGFDELTEFTEFQFWQLASRARLDCGVRPHIRATVTADGASWVRELIAWWIGEDGFPIAERSGVLRWVARDGTGAKYWGDSREEATRRAGDGASLAASVTFIPGAPVSNPMHAMLGQDEALRLRGNWNVRAVAPLAEKVAQQEFERLIAAGTPFKEAQAKASEAGHRAGEPAVTLISAGLVGPDPVEDGRVGVSCLDSVEYLNTTPTGACRRVTETAGGESLTFEDDRRLPAAGEADASELAKLETLVRKMIDGNFGAGEFIIGGIKVYVADLRYTTAVSGGINISTSPTPRTGGK